MTSEEHNKYAAYAFLAHAAFQFLMTLFIAAMFYFMFSMDDPSGPPPPPPAFFILIFGFMFVFQMLFAVPSLVASYAMLKRKPWARVAGIVAAALSAMNAPFGTAAAVYSLWFFCGDAWRSVYRETAEDVRRDPLRITTAVESEGYASEEEAAYTYRTPPPPDWR